MAPEDLEQLTQKIRDQLEESIIEKMTRQIMLSFSQMQSQGLALSPKPEVGPSAAHINTKESCVDPSGNDPDTGDLEKCRLYIEENPPRLVALGRLYEWSTTIHNIPLRNDQVKEVVGSEKLADNLDHDVDVPLYLMTLTIPQLFLEPLQVMWDATMFGVFNDNFPLYIKHEDLSEIAHGGQCLNISVIQLWILAHWQMVIILPKENVIIWFCSLHNRPNNYLKEIINSALKEFDDTLQSKPKVAARWIVVKYFNDTRLLELERLKALRI
ncbi:hypothetical protein HKD37_04G010646 [Glycine soja]